MRDIFGKKWNRTAIKNNGAPEREEAAAIFPK